MKQEIIEALCKAIAPTTPTDPIERGRVASLLLEFGKKEGPSINAAELARLVDVRLRQRKDPAGIAPQKIVEEIEATRQKKDPAGIARERIVEEIEATLDLVEMCEFMLEARRRQRRQTTSAMFNVALEKAPTEKEKQINAAIEGEKYPLDFTTGLIRMGVPGSPDKREKTYWEYFKRHCAGTESEIRESFEKWKKIGWENVYSLLATAQQFGRWWDASVLLNKRAAGKASGKARKPHSKRKK